MNRLQIYEYISKLAKNRRNLKKQLYFRQYLWSLIIFRDKEDNVHTDRDFESLEFLEVKIN
jgi:hypothetical protein